MPYADPEVAVVERLTAQVAALGGRVYTAGSEQDAAYPMAVITREGVESPNRMRSSGALKKYTLRVAVFGESVASALPVAASVVDALRGWKDTTVGVAGGFQLDDSDQGADDTGRPSTDRLFAIWFTPVA
jgi:hypothetical protein